MTSKRDQIIYDWEDLFLYKQNHRRFVTWKDVIELLTWLNQNFCPEVPARLLMIEESGTPSTYYRDGSGEIILNIRYHFNPETLCHEFAHHITWTGGNEKLGERYLHGVNWLTLYMCLLVHVCGYSLDYIVETADACKLSYDRTTLKRTIEQWKK